MLATGYIHNVQVATARHGSAFDLSFDLLAEREYACGGDSAIQGQDMSPHNKFTSQGRGPRRRVSEKVGLIFGSTPSSSTIYPSLVDNRNIPGHGRNPVNLPTPKTPVDNSQPSKGVPASSHATTTLFKSNAETSIRNSISSRRQDKCSKSQIKIQNEPCI